MEVQVERPSKTKKEVVREKAEENVREEEVEEMKQCVCQICTCGQHRCPSASSGSSGHHSVENVPPGGVTQTEGKNTPRRQQWRVSPELVRQISRSYRNLRDESVSETVETSTHETTVIDGRRRTSKESVTSRKDHTAKTTVEGRTEEKVTRSGKVTRTEELKSGLTTEATSDEKMSRHALDVTPNKQRVRLVEGEAAVTDGTQKQMYATDEAAPKVITHQADEPIADDTRNGSERTRLSSRSRPRTTLKLEGRHEYSTTSSDYFKDIGTPGIKRTERSAKSETGDGKETRVADDTPLPGKDNILSQEGQTVREHIQSGKAMAVDRSQKSADSQPDRPRTSLRMEGTHALMTTTSEDYKAHEQTEKVSRRLRPKKFDDPSYQVEQEAEKDEAKKRKVDASAKDDAKIKRTPKTPVVALQVDLERRETGASEESLRKTGVDKYDHYEESAETEDLLKRTSVRQTPKYDIAAGVPTGFDIDKRQKRRIKVGHDTSTTEVHPWNLRGKGTCVPRDNLRPASGVIDLHTTNQIEYYKKKMDRVRPIKPKALAKLFSSGSSTEEEMLLTEQRKKKRQYGLQRGHARYALEAPIPEHDESSSPCEDTATRRMTRTHPGTTSKDEGLVRARRYLMPYALADNIRFEGDTDFTTTSRESYKNDAVYDRSPGWRKSAKHEVFHEDTRVARHERFPGRPSHATYKTSEELNRIKSESSKHHIPSTYGRKDSAELIAEIQGLLTGKEKRKRKVQRHTDSDDSTKTTPEPRTAEEDIATSTSPQMRYDSPSTAEGHRDDVHVSDNHDASAVYKDTGRSAYPYQTEDIAGDVRQEASLDTTGHADYYRVEAAQPAKRTTDAHRAVQKPQQFMIAEMAVPVRPHTTLRTEPGQNGRDFSTTTGDTYAYRDGHVHPSPFYPRCNIRTGSGEMEFHTVTQDEYAPKTVSNGHVPVRPLTTLKLSEDTSYITRNEDKIGYSKGFETGFTSFGDTHYQAKRPTTTFRFGDDSPEFQTTSQKVYQKWETGTTHPKREAKTATAPTTHKDKASDKECSTTAGHSETCRRKHQKQAGISEFSTVTQSTYKHTTVERPQPYRPRTCLKIRCDNTQEVSTTTRETYRKVTPTARVKPIKRETCIHSLGDDDVPMPKVSMSGETFCPLQIPPKSQPFRPSDNLHLSGGMSFSTTHDTYFSYCKQDTEAVERVKPIRHQSVIQDIIFPTQVRTSSASSQESCCSGSRQVLKSVENVTGTTTRLKDENGAKMGQRVGHGASMRSLQDPRQLAISKTGGFSGGQDAADKSGAAVSHCPAARLDTNSSGTLKT
ncbi:uncharacterized protein LOC135389022 isoform X2 [Ornithodoros turicata]|uniref:uncharacterized protein LOC135389022 isoform X2 n=1 Tax=Ornithodoros turicata TaxID=34597 RepID=UPI003138B007